MGLKIPIRGNKIMRSEPTDTITIRVPNALKEKLEKKIKENQVTLNLLINQITARRMDADEGVPRGSRHIVANSWNGTSMGRAGCSASRSPHRR